MKVFRLSELRSGHTGRIVALHGEGESAIRLHALGFLPGKMVRHRNTAPLGDPSVYELDGHKVSLRRSEADLIEVADERA
jgi:ferrous iron transport protein B